MFSHAVPGSLVAFKPGAVLKKPLQTLLGNRDREPALHLQLTNSIPHSSPFPYSLPPEAKQLAEPQTVTNCWKHTCWRSGDHLSHEAGKTYRRWELRWKVMQQSYAKDQAESGPLYNGIVMHSDRAPWPLLAQLTFCPVVTWWLTSSSATLHAREMMRELMGPFSPAAESCGCAVTGSSLSALSNQGKRRLNAQSRRWLGNRGGLEEHQVVPGRRQGRMAQSFPASGFWSQQVSYSHTDRCNYPAWRDSN